MVMVGAIVLPMMAFVIIMVCDHGGDGDEDDAGEG